MPSATFVLKEPRSKEKTLLYMIFRYKNQKLKYSTKIKVNPKYWNANNQTFRETKDFTSAAEYNTSLKKLSANIDRIYRRLINDQILPTSEVLREELDKLSVENEIKPKNDFIAFVEDLINSSSKRPNTIKHYKQAFRVLQQFKAFTKKELSFEHINLNFYEEFMRYCTDANYGANTIGGYIKNIKVFMNEAFDRGLTKNIEYKNKKFRTIEEETETIYLTQSEIELLHKLDLRENERLDKVRDLFIIGCYTGLRYSDLIRLSEKNLSEDRTKLKIKTEKTGDMVIIPIKGIIRTTLTKFLGIENYSISNQKMNEYLKELGMLAGLNEKVLISTIRGGKKVSESFKKYELITVHTARRSFATNAYLNDVPTISIMKITGHRTEKAFLKYIKISQEDNANKLVNHKFFQ